MTYRPRGTPTMTLQTTVHMDTFAWLDKQAKEQGTSLGMVLDAVVKQKQEEER